MKLKKSQFLNYSILIPYVILSIIGLVMVYSTTSAVQVNAGRNTEMSFVNQTIFWLLGLSAIAVLYKMKLSVFRQKSVVNMVMIVEFLLIIISRFFDPVNGAHGWIRLGPISLQPAEYIKFIMIWFLAVKFSSIQEEIATYDYQALTRGRWIPNKIDDWRVVSLAFLLAIGVLPDLGNATILALIILVMYGLSGIAYRWFSTLLVSITAFSIAFLGLIGLIGVEVFQKIPLFGYVAKRFAAFFNPFTDTQEAGHQLANSYYAMSNGGWFGRGLGNSIEKTGYLPEAHNDFAFSITIEELGFVGAGLILALLFFLIIRIIIVGIRARNPFNAMVAMGTGAMLLIQTFINVGGISGLIPSTGVTFPFLSQGGSSLLIISVAIGFVLNIDADEQRRKLLEQERAR